MQMLTVSKVNLDEIRSHNKELSDGLLNNPFEHSQAFDAALKRVITALPNRPPIESSDDVVRLGLRLLNPVMSRTSLTSGRCITVPSSAALANMPAILEH